MKRLALPALVLLLAAGCGGGSTSVKDNGTVTASGDAAAQTATVGMTDSLKFAPNVVRAKVGTVTLSVVNRGKVPHNLTFRDAAEGATPTVDGGTTAPLKVVFDKAGTYTFTCTFHSGMTGKVVVS